MGEAWIMRGEKVFSLGGSRTHFRMQLLSRMIHAMRHAKIHAIVPVHSIIRSTIHDTLHSPLLVLSMAQ